MIHPHHKSIAYTIDDKLYFCLVLTVSVTNVNQLERSGLKLPCIALCYLLVRHERTFIYKVCVTAQEMRGGPSKPAYRSRLQTTSSCIGKEPCVVSVEEKAGQRSCQVRIKEMSASEPLMRCRNSRDGVKTGVLADPQDKPRGSLVTAWVASGIKVA
jgi:hypothetical protein